MPWNTSKQTNIEYHVFAIKTETWRPMPAAVGIGLHVNSHKIEYTSYNQRNGISTR